jgi:hypothetical protein
MVRWRVKIICRCLGEVACCGAFWVILARWGQNRDGAPVSTVFLGEAGRKVALQLLWPL